MIKSLTKHITLFLSSLCLLSGCVAEDDLKISNSDSDRYIEIPRINSFQELGEASTASWTVVSSPDWISPIKNDNDKNNCIRFVSETNYEDADRTGDIEIINAEGETQTFHVKQLGYLSDPVTRNEISQTDLTSTNGVGFCTDVFQSPQGAKYRVFASSPFSLKKLYEAANLSSGTILEFDAYTSENRAYSTVETITGSRIEDIANQVSVNAGIEAAIGAWTLGVSGGFNSKTDEHHKNFYALQEVKHIVKASQFRGGFLKYIAQDSALRKKYMDPDFVRLANKIDKTSSPQDRDDAMEKIVHNYGTHIITYGELGAELQFKMTIKADSSQNETVINAAVDLGNKAFAAGGKFDYSENEKSISSNTTIRLVTYGGNNEFGSNPGAPLAEFYTTVVNKENQEKWIAPVRERREQLALIDVQLMPIYELMPTQRAKDFLRNYIIGPYQKDMMTKAVSNYEGPQIYKINNYFTDVDFVGEKHLKIPSLNMEIVARREIVPQLSDKEYSTVIYSGPIGQVNRSSGFFIGTKDRCPCQFKINGNKFEKTFFDKISGPIQEIYVDRTCKITMSSKYDQSLLTSLSFPDWPLLDLSKLEPSDSHRRAIKDITEHTIIYGESSCYTILNIKTSEPVELYGMKLNGFIDNDHNVNVNIKLIPGTNNEIHNTSTTPLINIGDKGYTTEITGTGTLILNADYACIGRLNINTTGEPSDKKRPGGSLNLKEGTFEFNSIYGPAIGSSTTNNSIDQIEISNKATIKAKVQSPNTNIIGGKNIGKVTIKKDINSIQVRSPQSNYYLLKVPEQIIIEDPSKILNSPW